LVIEAHDGRLMRATDDASRLLQRCVAVTEALFSAPRPLLESRLSRHASGLGANSCGSGRPVRGRLAAAHGRPGWQTGDHSGSAAQSIRVSPSTRSPTACRYCGHGSRATRRDRQATFESWFRAASLREHSRTDAGHRRRHRGVTVPGHDPGKQGPPGRPGL
jgi:hypothetical protein